MSKQLRFIAGQYVDAAMRVWAMVDSSGIVRSATLAASAVQVGTYYPLGDGSQWDLVQQVEDRVNVALTIDGEVVSITMDANGVISIDGSDDTTLYFNDPDNTGGVLSDNNTMEVADGLFGFDDPVIYYEYEAFNVYEGTRTGQLTFMPQRYLFKDIPGYKELAGQSRAGSGRVRTVHYSSQVEHTFKVLLEGAYPRSLLHNEWKAFRSFIGRISTGVQFRVYPDWDNEKGAFDEYTNPYGYSTFQLKAENYGWSPQGPFQGKSYRRFEKSLHCYLFKG